MPRPTARLTTITLALLGAPTLAIAAPKPLIGYFQPMPIVGKLSTTVWGASAVGARDPANGLEDNGANGGVGPQQETNFYWDGKIVKGEDGKYHLYASHWDHSIGFGPPSGGSTGWETSIPMQAVSANLIGPYVSQGNCYTKNREGTNLGHNVTAVVAPSGAMPYTLSVGEIVPGQMFGAASASGPWTLLGPVTTNTNGHGNCGDLASNFTFTVGPDQRFWATSRGGCVMDSDQPLGTYKVETDRILPSLEGSNTSSEDEVIWYSGGAYHIVYNYWNVQRAYHIMSKDGIHNWTSTGLAYEGTQSPQNASSKWLRYTDGTVNQWHNMERPGVYEEHGHVAAFTFAVTDTDKNATGVNQGGSKIIVVPFDGVQFDCDNGDAASCAELGGGGGTSGGGGASGGGGSGGARAAGGAGGASGSSGAAGVGGQSRGTGGAVATGGITGTGGSSGTGGTPGTGGHATGTGGVAATGGSSGGATGGTTGAGGTPATGGGPAADGGCACSTAEGASSSGLILGTLALLLVLAFRRRQARLSRGE